MIRLVLTASLALTLASTSARAEECALEKNRLRRFTMEYSDQMEAMRVLRRSIRSAAVRGEDGAFREIVRFGAAQIDISRRRALIVSLYAQALDMECDSFNADALERIRTLFEMRGRQERADLTSLAPEFAQKR